MLAVPVQRSSIVLAKFITVTAWCAVMAIMMLVFGLIMGAIIQLSGGSMSVILDGSAVALITVCLIIADVLPFAFFASVGRGYMLPMALAVLTLMMANIMMVVGRAEYFPWAIPVLYAQGESSLTPFSYGIVFGTSVVGMVATYVWWKYADQNR